MGVLRLLLALVVVIAHCGAIHGFAPLNGFVAVQTFFMISGFYMAMILTEKYQGTGSYRLFLSNRFLRIYPTYWLVMLFSLGVSALTFFKMGVGPLAVLRETGFRGALLLTISNLTIFGQDLVMFVGSQPRGHLFFTPNFHSTSPQLWSYLLIPPGWSLSLELAFYAVAPLLVRRPSKYIVALITLSLALRAFLSFDLHLTNDPWAARFFPTEIVFFLAGVLAYRIYLHLQHRDAIRRWSLPITMALIDFCLAYQLAPNWAIGGLLIKQVLFYCTAWAAIPFAFAVSRNSQIDRYIGELSYPMYLIHYPMLRLMAFCVHRLHVENTLPIVAILTTLAASMLITSLLEIPIGRLRTRRVAVAQLQGAELALA